MDTVEVGEYLKRLRLIHGYTQSELGKKLNVSDKAISRWENGAGMPEISNLVTIADLFGVSVDDILRCNPNALNGHAFGAEIEADKTDETVAPQAQTTTVETPQAQNTIDLLPQNQASESVAVHIKAQNKNIASKKIRPDYPSAADRFYVIIFSAFLAFGIYAAIFIPTVNFGSSTFPPDTVIFVFICAIALLSAVATVLTLFLPRKISILIKTAICAVCSLLTAVLAIIFAAKYGNEHINVTHYSDRSMSGYFAATICTEFLFLLATELLFLIADFTDKAELKEIIGYARIGSAAAAVITAIAVTVTIIVKSAIKYQAYDYGSCLFLCTLMLLIGLAALTFILKDRGIKCGVMITILLFAVAGVSLGGSFYFLEIFETPFLIEHPIGLFYFAIALFAPAVHSLGFRFSGTRYEKSAARIVTPVSLLLLIPCLCYTLDVFAIDTYISAHGYATAVFLRIAALIAMTTAYVTQFVCTFKKETV